MSCPTTLMDPEFLQGLICMGSSMSNISACCDKFLPFAGCEETIAEVAGSAQVCEGLLSNFNASGMCYLTVGLLEMSVCYPSDSSTRNPENNILEGTLFPSYSWVFLSLFGIGAALYTMFLTWHFLRRENLKFQGIFVVLVSCLFLILPATLVIVFVPSSTPIIETMLAVLEGYLAYMFGGMMVSWGNERGSVESCMMKSEASMRPFSLFRCGCGPKFPCGHYALRHWRRCVLQFVLVKTFTQLANLSMVFTTDSVVVNSMFKLLLSVINLLSILIMLKGLTSIYFGLKQQNLLDGLGAISKFAVVKVMFSLLVINNLLLANLLSKGIMSPPEWICEERDGTVLVPSECDVRFLMFIVLCETVVLLTWAVFAYSPKTLNSSTSTSFSAFALTKEIAHRTMAWKLWETSTADKAGEERVCVQCGDLDLVPIGSAPARTKSEKDMEIAAQDNGYQGNKELGIFASEFQPKADKYNRLAIYTTTTSALLLALGALVPIWYETESDGCKISISYVDSAWCHGTCSIAPIPLQTAVASKNATLQALLYTICNANQATPIWSQAGVTLAYFAVLLAIYAVVFRKRLMIFTAGTVAVIPFVLMVTSAPPMFQSNQAMITLRTSFGFSDLYLGVSWFFFLIGIVLTFVSVLLVHRFRVYHAKTTEERVAQLDQSAVTGMPEL